MPKFKQPLFSTKVQIRHSNGLIATKQYFSFGLQTSTSWTRENTKDNTMLYNAANELNKTSGWYEMYYRGYDPAIGRMLQVDPYATSYASFTTYNYAVNNPVMVNDPSGGYAMDYQPGMSGTGVSRYNRIAAMGEAGNYDGAWFDSFSSSGGMGGGGKVTVIKGPNGEFWGYKFSGSSASSFFSTLQLGAGISLNYIPGGGKRGNDLVTIDLVSLLVDASSKNLSDKKMRRLADRIDAQIEETWSGSNRGLDWKTSATVAIKGDKITVEDPFIFYLVDDIGDIFPDADRGHAGRSAHGWNSAYIELTGNVVAETAAHEFGHALGLNDMPNQSYWIKTNGGSAMQRFKDGDLRGNIMYQSINIDNRGTTSAIDQILNIFIDTGLMKYSPLFKFIK